MANRYWVNGSGDWTDSSHWSATSGGAGGASVPTESDNAYFNSASATGPFAVAAPPSLPAKVRALSIKPAGEVSLTGRLSVYGALSNNSNLRTPDWFYISIWGNSNSTLGELTESADKMSISQYGAGVLSLGGTFYGENLRIGGGTFITNGHAINATVFSVNGHLGAIPTADLANSIINVRTYGTSSDAVVSASKASLNIRPHNSSSLYNLNGDNALGNVRFIGNGYARIKGSNTFSNLTLDPGLTLTIETGGSSATTNTVTGSFTANGTSSKQIIIRSSTAGLQHVWRKTSGTVNAHYLDLKDSVAIGGATFNANTSVNSGNNSGWNFIGPVAPTASFTASPWSGRAPLTTQFTDTSTGSPTSWLWNFGDGTTSTARNPSKTYSNPGTYTVSLNVQNNLGGSTTTRTVEATVTTIGVAGINANTSAAGSPTITTGGVTTSPGSAVNTGTTLGSPTINPGVVSVAMTAGADATGDDTGTPTVTQSPPPPPPPTDWEAIGKEDEKVYVYKVYKPDGSFFGVWNDVKDIPQFTQQINTPGTTMTVQLARSPNTTREVRAALTTEDGEPLTTEDGHNLVATYETNNNVGEDTDVDLNLNVDIYVHYGEYAYLATQDGEPITTQNGEKLMVASGAPMGVRIFSGFILDYDSVYGDDTGVTVTLASHGYELSHELIRNGETINVSYSSQDHAAIMKSILEPQLGSNVALGKTVTPSSTTSINPVDVVTNGNTATAEYVSVSHEGADAAWVQVDLGAVTLINGVKVWHYYADGRSYSGHKTEVSEDGLAWTVVDEPSPYPETSAGRTISFSPLRARYVRNYLSGSTANSGNHWVEIEVYRAQNARYMYYDSASIQNTGQSVSMKFQLNTKLEGIKSVFDQTPDGWYWFGNPADNLVYLRQRSTTPRHTFIKGKHIKSMRLKRTMEGLTNRVYFVGGEKTEGNPATTLFKKYEDTASQAQWRVGLERITDRRYTLDSSAQNRSMKLINSLSQPVFTMPLTISSARYDLESIRLGDTVGFGNFDNFVDDVVLQIMALSYTPTAVTLELGALLARQVDSVAEVEGDLSNEQYQKIPDQPS